MTQRRPRTTSSLANVSGIDLSLEIVCGEHHSKDRICYLCPAMTQVHLNQLHENGFWRVPLVPEGLFATKQVVLRILCIVAQL